MRESATSARSPRRPRHPRPRREKPTSKEGGAVANGEDKSEEQLDPETKKVKEWRHKVQKVFSARRGTINADDMPGADAAFKVIEEYEA